MAIDMMHISDNTLILTRHNRLIPIQRITDADRAKALRQLGWGEWQAAGLIRGLITVKGARG